MEHQGLLVACKRTRNCDSRRTGRGLEGVYRGLSTSTTRHVRGGVFDGTTNLQSNPPPRGRAPALVARRPRPAPSASQSGGVQAPYHCRHPARLPGVPEPSSHPGPPRCSSSGSAVPHRLAPKRPPGTSSAPRGSRQAGIAPAMTLGSHQYSLSSSHGARRFASRWSDALALPRGVVLRHRR